MQRQDPTPPGLSTTSYFFKPADPNKLERQPWQEKLVRLAGIEPTTLGFGGQYSIH